ncbi:3-dehydroquinate synthase [Halosquirtibacter laminarini]|uniref:3-dehydroquinate synthase n=1 Tax=Halosquirtibacter laminarini TaxID=3374600 RepID=A0AC61NCZ7_9BACT|nr:3-dehydroquinate synthase [Prolixibacteraceae bacterium]
MIKEAKIQSDVIITNQIVDEIRKLLKQYENRSIFVFTDINTTKFCLPIFSDLFKTYPISYFEMEPGEENKSMETVVDMWNFFGDNGADRKSLVIQIGGGLLTDIGGFAASTFKRGMDFVNIPTTLLSQVDASVGGKTGFNFNGLKNEIGVIRQPNRVFIDPIFLKTLESNHIISGYAEMLKHGFIFDKKHLDLLLQTDIVQIDSQDVSSLIKRSIEIKDHFVHIDPNEKGIRKALNFGHTIGHSLESFFISNHVHPQHGYAVAWGMIAELYLSYLRKELPLSQVDHYSNEIIKHFGDLPIKIEKKHYDTLLQWISKDKKNEGKKINFTLLSEIGKYSINEDATQEEILDSIEFLIQKTANNDEI